MVRTHKRGFTVIEVMIVIAILFAGGAIYYVKNQKSSADTDASGRPIAGLHAPYGVRADAWSSSEIQIRWRDGSESETDYLIYQTWPTVVRNPVLRFSSHPNAVRDDYYETRIRNLPANSERCYQIVASSVLYKSARSPVGTTPSSRDHACAITSAAPATTSQAPADDRQAPTITNALATPNRLKAGNSLSVTLQATDNVAVRQVSAALPSSFGLPKVRNFESLGNNQYRLNISNVPKGNYVISLTATDTSDNIKKSSVRVTATR